MGWTPAPTRCNAVLFLVLVQTCGFAGALRHGAGKPGGSPSSQEHRAARDWGRAPPAFVAPAVDLRQRSVGSSRPGVCMQMQLPPNGNGAGAAQHDTPAERAEKRDVAPAADGKLSTETREAALVDAAVPDAAERVEANGGAELGGVMLSSRRAAISVGLGLLLGPMIPIMTTALTGEPAAHAAAGAAAGAGGGEKKPFEQKTLKEILQKSAARALGGGKSGAAAGVLQVISLMWLRTTMNYQYRYGGSTTEVLQKLYGEGGVGRFYRGLGFALIQQPLSRFGDTAANAGMAVFLDSFEETRHLPVLVKTLTASSAAAAWRIGLMPVDNFKTSLQVDGKEGVKQLWSKIERRGLGVLYDGSAATLGSSFVGHYPWFATFNSLQASVPEVGDSLAAKLVRNAAIGLCASAVSDCCSNSFRVVKTLKQTATDEVSYTDAIKGILKEDGFQGLFGRGLQTRLITNGLQGMLFSVVWKFFDEYWK